MLFCHLPSGIDLIKVIPVGLFSHNGGESVVADADGNKLVSNCLTSSPQPITSRIPKTVLDCREGTPFILPTQVNSTIDSIGVAHALDPIQQTQPAARKSLPTEPQTHAQQTRDASFWNEGSAGKDAVMAKEFAS